MSVSDGINDKFEKSVINLNFIEKPEAIDMNEVPKKAPDKKPEETDSLHEVEDKESETKSPEKSTKYEITDIVKIDPKSEKFTKKLKYPAIQAVETNVNIPESLEEKSKYLNNVLTDISKMIPDNSNAFVLKSYIRILELDVLYYYILEKIVSIVLIKNLEAKVLQKHNPTNKEDIKKKLVIRFQKLKKSIGNQLKKYEISDTFNGVGFLTFSKILERDKLYIYKNYCLGQKCKNIDKLSEYNYNGYDEIQKIKCIKTIGSVNSHFKNSILDQSRIKYDSEKHHQSQEYSFYQTIAQPLQFDTDEKIRLLTILNNRKEKELNIQNKNEITGDEYPPGTKLCFNDNGDKTDDVELDGFFNNIEKYYGNSSKYNTELHNPKLGKIQPLNYSKGVNKFLHDKINYTEDYKKYIIDKQDFSSGGDGKTRTLREQIRDNRKIIKKFKILIAKKLLQFGKRKNQLSAVTNIKDDLSTDINNYLKDININDAFAQSLNDTYEKPFTYKLCELSKPNKILISLSSYNENEITNSLTYSIGRNVERHIQRFIKPVSKVIFKCQRIDCPLADKEFTSLQALLLHTREYHSGNMWVCQRISNINTSENEFKTCGKEFKTLQDLREHDIKCHPIDVKPDESCFDDDPEKHGQLEEQDQDDDDVTCTKYKFKINATEEIVPICFSDETTVLDSKCDNKLLLISTDEKEHSGYNAENNTFSIGLNVNGKEDNSIEVADAVESIKSGINKAVKYYKDNKGTYNCIAHPGTQSKTNYYKHHINKLNSNSIYDDSVKETQITQTTIIPIDINKLKDNKTEEVDLIKYAGSSTNVELTKCKKPLDLINDKIDNFFNEHKIKPSASTSTGRSEPEQNATADYLKTIYNCYETNQDQQKNRLDSECLDDILKLRKIFINPVEREIREDELTKQQDASEFIIKIIELLKFEDIFNITETNTISCINGKPNVLKKTEYDVAGDNFIITNQIFEKIDGGDPKKIDTENLILEIQKKVSINQNNFNLTGFIVHISSGNDKSLDKGHYISYIKSNEDKWYKISDSEVKEVKLTFPLREVVTFPLGAEDTERKGTEREKKKFTRKNYPYVLFYSTGNPMIKPPIGIPNLGNTCYINSVLQNLFNIKAVREKLE